MKRYRLFFCVIFLIFTQALFSQETIPNNDLSTDIVQTNEAKKEKTDYDEKYEVLEYGLTSEVIELVTNLKLEKDTRFNTFLVDLFKTEKNIKLKLSILDFFMTLEDNSLENEVPTIISNYADYNTEFLRSCIQYCSKLKLQHESVKTALKTIIDDNKTDLKESAILALGTIGSTSEALYLVDDFEAEGETGNDTKLTLVLRQAIMQALIDLHDRETVDFLTEKAKDTYENSIIRARAITALGKIGLLGENGSDESIIDLLASSYEDTDPIIREATIAGISGFKGNGKASKLLLLAFKDEYYKVRLKAIESALEAKNEQAIPLLFYRAKNDPENAVKLASINALGELGNEETNTWLCDTFSNQSLNSDIRIKACLSLLKNNPDVIIPYIEKEILACINNRQKKQFAYNLGKQISSYSHEGLVRVAEAFLNHNEAAYKSIGLDMFKTNLFSSLVPVVKKIADDEKSGALKKRAQGLLPDNIESSTIESKTGEVEKPIETTSNLDEKF